MADRGAACTYDDDTQQYWLDAVDGAIDQHPFDAALLPWSMVIPCPRCTHSMQKEITTIVRSLVDGQPDSIYVACNCVHDTHDKQPDGMSGCGYHGHFLAPWARQQGGQQ